MGKIAMAACDIVIAPEFILMCPLLPKYSSRTNLGRQILESELKQLLGFCKLKFMKIYLNEFHFLNNSMLSLFQTCALGGLFSNDVLFLYVYSKQRPKRAFLRREVFVNFHPGSAERTGVHPCHGCIRCH